jgi:hypothetical protein
MRIKAAEAVEGEGVNWMRVPRSNSAARAILLRPFPVNLRARSRTTMSFDIFFQPCRYGDARVDVKNPFTGQVQSVPRNDPLTATDLSPASLREHWNSTTSSPGTRGQE